MTEELVGQEEPEVQLETQRIELSFEPFGLEGLAEAASQLSLPEERVVALACMRFTDTPPEGPARTVPTFLARGGEPRTFEIDLPVLTWVSLREEAGEQDVPLERLMEHAVITGLANCADREPS